MIFKSHQVNLDPEPQIHRHAGCILDGRRIERAPYFHDDEYDPRPEFEPTRDPKPWMDSRGTRFGVKHSDRYGTTEWAPRRKQFDTPVNRLLVSVREGMKIRVGREQALLALWLGNLDPRSNPAHGFSVTQAEVHHARRVLTRLATWTKGSA